MPRSNKTSSVLKLIGAEAENIKPKKSEHSEAKNNTALAPEYSETPAENETSIKNESVHKNVSKRPRKTVIKKPKVLNLFGDNTASNPALRQAGADEPTYRRHGNERQIVNVSALLICEQLTAALDRFNSCDCDLCCRVITEKALSLMPDCFIRVKTKPDEEYANEEIKRLRPEAIKVLTRLCITARTRPYHNT